MTDELISKTDVVKIVKSVLSPASSLTNVARARRQMLDQIYELESKPEPHWIPVTKDTPKEVGTYMCTCYDAGRRIVTLVKWQPRTKTWNLIGARAYWKVIAWCKRPEPYKEMTE